MTVTLAIADAGARRRRDPTGTSALRRTWRSAAEMRLRQLRAQLRIAVIEDDVLGLGASALRYQPEFIRIRHAREWFERVAHDALCAGQWCSPYTKAAWQSGHAAAAREVGRMPPLPEHAGEALAAAAESESVGIVAALVQQVTRAMVTAITGKMKPRAAYSVMVRAFDRITPRLRANVNVVTVTAHNQAKLHVYRQAGIERVGIAPELLHRAHKHTHMRTRDYSPDQPREPAGTPEGGRWTSAAGGGGSGESGERYLREETNWATVKGQNPKVINTPLPHVKGKWHRTGVLIEEPDGSVWVIKPSGGFAGGRLTFPKGGVEKGLSPQANAIKEVFEETGLEIEITGHVGDFERNESVSRYYTGRRIGGDPTKHGWEVEQVMKVPRADLPALIEGYAEKEILAAYMPEASITQQKPPEHEETKVVGVSAERFGKDATLRNPNGTWADYENLHGKFAQQPLDLTPQQKEAVAYWGDPSGYKALNGQLRGAANSAKAAKLIPVLDKAIAASPLPNHAIAWRGLHGPHAAALKKLKAGDTFWNAGYTSTTIDPRRSTHYGMKDKPGIVVVYHLPKGYPALYTSHPNAGGWSGLERELLLPHGARFKILGTEAIKSPVWHYTGQLESAAPHDFVVYHVGVADTSAEGTQLDAVAGGKAMPPAEITPQAPQEQAASKPLPTPSPVDAPLAHAYSKAQASGDYGEYAKLMQERLEAVAVANGFDPKMINATTASGASVMGTVLGKMDPKTNKLVIYARHCSPATYAGVAAHEINHAKFQSLWGAFKNDEEPWKSQFIAAHDLPKLREEGGVSGYSKQWWAKVTGPPGPGGHNWRSAVYETLAEMARVHQDTGRVVGGPYFRALYKLIDDHWSATHKLWEADSLWLDTIEEWDDGGMVCWLDDNFEPVDEAVASFGKVVYADGPPVFILPERMAQDTLTTLFDRTRRGAGSRISREHAPSESTIRRIEKQARKVEEEVGEEVGILTAGDDKVCDECEEIAANGPYPIDEAFGLIPAHINCRCVFVPASDARFAGDALIRDFNPYHLPAGSPEGGQFTFAPEGVVGGGSAEPRYEPPPVKGRGDVFASPSVQSINFENARAALTSHRQRVFARAARDVDSKTRMGRARQANTIGAWADGAENSTLVEADKVSSSDLELNAAIKGLLGHQKQVLVFDDDPHGPDQLYTFRVSGDLGAVHERLLDAGLDFHTLVPKKGGAEVTVIDQDGTAPAKIATMTNRTKVINGKASFIGTQKQDGTDEEQRADAQQIFEGIIERSGDRGRALWKKLRDRWAPQLEIAEGKGIRPAASPWPERISAREFTVLAERVQREVLERHAVAIGHDKSSYKARLIRNIGEAAAAVRDFAEWTNWYDRHRPLAKALFGADEPMFENLLAATSLQKSPGQNVALALAAYERWKSGEPFETWHPSETSGGGGVLPRIREKLVQLQRGEALTGAKIKPFAAALNGDWSQVVIDRWMIKILFNDPNATATEGQVAIGQAVITAFANRVGWKPAEFQAALWCMHKASRESGNSAVVTSFRPYIEAQIDRIHKMFEDHPEWKPKGVADAEAVATMLDLSLADEEEAWLNALMLVRLFERLSGGL